MRELIKKNIWLIAVVTGSVITQINRPIGLWVLVIVCSLLAVVSLAKAVKVVSAKTAVGRTGHSQKEEALDIVGILVVLILSTVYIIKKGCLYAGVPLPVVVLITTVSIGINLAVKVIVGDTHRGRGETE